MTVGSRSDNAPSSAEPTPVASVNSPVSRSRLVAYVAIGLLLLAGTGLFAAGAIAKVRQPAGQPAPKVLGVAAWQVATAGFACTLTGALWLRRLVG